MERKWTIQPQTGTSSNPQYPQVDIALISETYFTSRSVFKIPYYSVYHTIHPDDTAHGGAAIIVRSSLSHYVLPPHQSESLQAATV